jgi:hypothetical protein
MAHYRGALCHEGYYNLRCSEQQQMQTANVFGTCQVRFKQSPQCPEQGHWFCLFSQFRGTSINTVFSVPATPRESFLVQSCLIS